MELWIRSQDRQELELVNGRFHVQETRVNPHSHKWGILVDGRTYLGEYDTEKRALEVLDEIHQRLINLGTLEIAPDSYIVLPKDTSNVYEMPQE